ncbi:uncharacterized protein LY89DRAFT_665237 [Mollisia scopiformis]|uniref:Uncharacterized protein n=1 Tax=Mollisia scopiformis TaxID=149040 RepID=A0A194XQU9_MOLSC|nr:uncharacterized protein LY89DRAFT_665237 [Mollisia scopiformis]KUJ22102.1 hypothetical protein LY89DRAFT_665237 [Mollisia scopiformis]
MMLYHMIWKHACGGFQSSQQNGRASFAAAAAGMLAFQKHAYQSLRIFIRCRTKLCEIWCLWVSSGCLWQRALHRQHSETGASAPETQRLSRQALLHHYACIHPLRSTAPPSTTARLSSTPKPAKPAHPEPDNSLSWQPSRLCTSTALATLQRSWTAPPT